ncbi:DUF6415 family natural product biosynthesis protein [Streptomyces sp. NPDC093109]|uniref:DUF6415 family natural product biosynthesis protein n=1 Tax=Streptomyces sp. NPDC093109 TaxID=3154977 RepID=UPI00344FE3AF
MSTRTVLYDPEGLLDTDLPLDRDPHLALAKSVLAWPASADVPPNDCEQIALQLTGHARAVATDVQRRAAGLPKDDGRRALAEVVLTEAAERLSGKLLGTPGCVQSRARLVLALYERLDRLEDALPAAPATGP